MYIVGQIFNICIIFICCAHSCKHGQPNCTCVTYFQASSDVLGPEHPRHLGSKVNFKASASWAFNLSLGFKAYVENTLIMTFPKSIYNQSCGSQMSRHFQFFNHRRDLDNPSGYPKVDIVLYADHPDNPEGGALNCSNVLCSRFQVHYNFPPGPGNIEIILDPPNAGQGEPATIKCSTIDGFPKVRFGIRAFSLVYNLELFYSPGETLYMPAAVAGTYSCEAITYIFGQKVVVPSDKKIAIVRRSVKATDEVALAKSNWNHVIKFWSRDISMVKEKDEEKNGVGSSGHIQNPVYAVDHTLNHIDEHNVGVDTPVKRNKETSAVSSAKMNVETTQSPRVTLTHAHNLVLSHANMLSIEALFNQSPRMIEPVTLITLLALASLTV